jgi:iron complex outermembrane receptor protein
MSSHSGSPTRSSPNLTWTRSIPAAFASLLLPALPWAEAPAGRGIEEIVITAERREARVSDTPISVTAFDAARIEQLGMQGPDDLVNNTPALMRNEYEVRIRGVGRNFRALGGDPGVATYLNGVYSEDFTIAATENALFDVARIEILRGPQGTLYGRNSIGGAINYITKAPTMSWMAEARTQFGNLGNQEYGVVLSGPLLTDTLAVRLTGTRLLRDGSLQGDAGSDDVDSMDDENHAIALLYEPGDAFSVALRWNDRRSERRIGVEALTNEGPAGSRGVRDTVHYAYGLRPVTAADPDALPFVNPITGATVHGAYVRPGVDPTGAFPFQPNPAFLSPVARLNDGIGDNDVDRNVLVNDGTAENADHRALTSNVSWRAPIGTFTYIFGRSDYSAFLNVDYDWSNEVFSQGWYPISFDLENQSHELQYLWEIGTHLTGTSGLYTYDARSTQDFGVANPAAQGRYTAAMNYGALEDFAHFLGPHRALGSAAPQEFLIGIWGGDPHGYAYHTLNRLTNTSYAAYTQAKYAFDDAWALTLGLRWAKDEKEADEQIAGYSEDNFTFFPFLVPLMPLLGGSVANTPLANANILWGAATLNADPAVQINPTCGLKDACTTPLRLGGLPFSFASRTAGDHAWSHTTWRANLDWTPGVDTLVYVSATTGFRSGGYSLGLPGTRDFVRDPDGNVISFGSIGAPFVYDKETVISYEIGYKNLLLDGALQIFASTYVYRYEDYQDQGLRYDPVRNTGVEVVTNAPEARNFGIEVEATWLSSDALTLGGNYSYSSAEYSADYWLVDFTNPDLPPSILGPIEDPENREIYLVNVNGNDLRMIPRHKGAIWGSYQWVTGIGRVSANAMVAYIGEYYSSALNSPYAKTPDHTQVDVSVLWSNRSDMVHVRAFVDNVFDEGYLRDVAGSGEGENWAQYANYLYPRFYGVELRWSFGGG